MHIILSEGDELVVKLEDTDGEFRIHFNTKTYPKAIIVEETGGFPDDDGRGGILYKEEFKRGDTPYKGEFS